MYKRQSPDFGSPEVGISVAGIVFLKTAIVWLACTIFFECSANLTMLNLKGSKFLHVG